MPNFDAGSYFLTALIPISNEIVSEPDAPGRSAAMLTRRELALLPTAQQSPNTYQSPLNSPFARCTRTHFLRMFVLEDVVFNGRDPKDAVLTSLSGDNPIVAGHVDRLKCPYLVFIVDFDAASGERAELNGYLEGLWEKCEDELRAVFRYCRRFDTVETAADFAAYVRRCQVETTMSFHDYYPDPVDPSKLPTFPLNLFLYPLIAAAAAVVAAVLARIFVPGLFGWDWAGIGLVALLILVAIGIVFYNRAMAAGAKPFPSPDAPLPKVLKALYLQRRLVDFAAGAQGMDDKELHEAFGRFLAEHKPGDLTGPTQPPGVIWS